MTRTDELRAALRRLMAAGRPSDEIAEELQNLIPGISAQEVLQVQAMIEAERQIG